jgi:hypothetical protein
MIPNQEQNKVVSNFSDSETSQHKMQIDQNSLVHIMSILSSLYSDEELAILREYASNALDSHIQAGNPDPIEIELPSNLSPILKIIDKGVGLTIDELLGLFGKYGASNKRLENTTTGCLGLGSKSALCYCSQFSIIAVKNNVKATAIVSVDENGLGQIEIIDTSSTQQPNGVEVRIPVKNVNFFAAKAESFFKVWPENSVLINGEEPAKLIGKRLKSGSHTIVFEETLDRSYNSYDYVVMSNISYPVERFFPRASYYSPSIYVFVDNGEVQFTPSREKLHLTSSTKSVLENLRAEIKSSAEKDIEESLSKSSTKTEALVAFMEVRKRYSDYFSISPKWNDEDIPDSFREEVFVYSPPQGYSSYRNTDSRNSITIPLISQSILIQGYDCKSVTSSHKAKIRRFVENLDIDQPKTFLIFNTIKSPWLQDIDTFSWDDIKLTKLDRKNVNPLKPSMIGKYSLLDSRGISTSVEAKNLPTKDLYYISGSALENAGPLARKYLSPGSKITLASIPNNRLSKFKRLFPTAKPIEEFILNKAKELEKNITKDHLDAETFRHSSNANIISILKGRRTLDEDFNKLIKLIEIDLADLWLLTATMRYISPKERVKFSYLNKNLFVDKVSGKYPLLKSINQYSLLTDDLVNYIDAIYTMTSIVSETTS